ncbi:hypothetical protein D3C81_2313850 [compost metagenome]
MEQKGLALQLLCGQRHSCPQRMARLHDQLQLILNQRQNMQAFQRFVRQGDDRGINFVMP